MKLERVIIRRMPGIDESFTLDDLKDGLNLIVGNNATGKTTVCRSIRALLWPAAENPNTISVETLWTDSTGQWWAQREGRRTSWHLDGIGSPGPRLPDDRFAHCFTLGIRDLLLEENPTDTQIAQEILRQVAGGYDVQEISDRHFSVPGKPGKPEGDRLKASQRNVEAIRREQLNLLDAERSLQDLARQQAESRQAGVDIGLLEFAREYAEVKAELEGVHSELETFPDGMDRIRGDELSRIEDLERERNAVLEKIRGCAERIDEAQRAIRESNIPSAKPVAETLIAELLHRARSLQERERDLAEACDATRHAETGVEQARRTLAPNLDPEATLRVDAAGLKEIDSYFRHAEALKARRAAVSEEKALLDAGGEHRPKQVYEQAMAALRGWIAARALAEWLRARGGGYLAGIIFALAGGILFLFDHRIGAFLLGGGLALIGFTWLLTRRLHQAQGSHREEYEGLDLTPIQAWKTDPVRRQVQSLGEEWQAAAAAESRTTRLEKLQARERGIEDDSRTLEETRASLRSELGLDPGATDMELYLLAKNVLAYLETEKALSQATDREEGTREDVQSLLSAINAPLQEYGCESGRDAAHVLALADDLKNRNGRLAQALRDIERERANTQELERDVSRHEERIGQIYLGAGLEQGDRLGLNARLELHEHFRSAAQKRDRLAGRHAELRAKLEGRQDLIDLTLEEAEVRKARAEGKAEDLEKLSESVGTIQERVRAAKEGDALERALEEVASAAGALREKREETLLRIAGRFLLDRVMAEYDVQHRPEVLQRASGLFSRFTHHEYEIAFEGRSERPELRALETSTRRGKALSELSDATRMQLLLASRLAHLDQVERGTKLPIFLDEVLTTTDPSRFGAIAESVLALIGEGRQVFYLSANPADVSQWKRVLEQNHLDPIEPIDLGALRRMGAAVSSAGALEIEAPPQVPPPDGLNPEEYGARIGVPPLNPERPADSVHLFYLLRHDLAILHTLLTNGVETVGQWRSLVRSGTDDVFVTREDADRLTTFADTLQAFLGAGRIGRGRRVDGEVLRAAGVTPTYLERLPGLVEELGGNAQSLIGALEEKQDKRTHGFRSAALDSLREYFAEHGYIDERAPMDEVSLKAQVLSQVGRRLETASADRDEVVRLINDLIATMRAP